MPRNCPKCDALMEYQEPEPDVGIEGCYVCTNEKCGHVVDLEEEDHSDD